MPIFIDVKVPSVRKWLSCDNTNVDLVIMYAHKSVEYVRDVTNNHLQSKALAKHKIE